MSRKRKLIIVAVLIVAAVAIIAIVVTVAGFFLLRPSGDTEALLGGATAVGIPDGPAVTKNIGPSGGSIESPDGRITVVVPPGAVPELADRRHVGILVCRWSLRRRQRHVLNRGAGNTAYSDQFRGNRHRDRPRNGQRQRPHYDSLNTAGIKRKML